MSGLNDNFKFLSRSKFCEITTHIKIGRSGLCIRKMVKSNILVGQS